MLSIEVRERFSRVASLACLTVLGCGPPSDPSDAGTDAAPIEYDAYAFPVERVYLNPDPPRCLDREQPPTWRVTTEPAMRGTISWTRDLNEPQFERWRDLASSNWLEAPPSLSGDGIATWFFWRDVSNELWGLGLGPPDGVFANSGTYDRHFLPRIWLPRFDALYSGQARDARRMFAPQPDDYAPRQPDDFEIQVGVGEFFYEGGPTVHAVPDGDKPAWSPVTGDFVTFGINYGAGEPQFRGVGAACSEGTRWFTQLPIYEGQSAVYVRANGDVVIVARGEAWVLDGQTGELISTANLARPGGVLGMPAAYQPGCGVLIVYNIRRDWTWLDDETMELGPLLNVPDAATSNVGLWSGTQDCGVVAVGGVDPVVVTRLEADGSVRYSVPFRQAGERMALAGPPVPLADGGTLLITGNPPGWNRLSATGELIDRYRIDPVANGSRTLSEPAIAPDGTLYFMTESPAGIRFLAVSTGGIVPGPFLWPNSGLNWARTNSVLPE